MKKSPDQQKCVARIVDALEEGKFPFLMSLKYDQLATACRLTVDENFRKAVVILEGDGLIRQSGDGAVRFLEIGDYTIKQVLHKMLDTEKTIAARIVNSVFNNFTLEDFLPTLSAITIAGAHGNTRRFMKMDARLREKRAARSGTGHLLMGWHNAWRSYCVNYPLPRSAMVEVASKHFQIIEAMQDKRLELAHIALMAQHQTCVDSMKRLRW